MAIGTTTAMATVPPLDKPLPELDDNAVPLETDEDEIDEEVELGEVVPGGWTVGTKVLVDV
jgi:hypothetical protein